MKTIRVRYACPKCSNHEFEVGEVFMPGSIWAKLLNFEFRKFTTTTCTKCSHTELYKHNKDSIQNTLDFIVGDQRGAL